MIKTLKKHGNSHALLIDKALMEVLGINESTELKLTIDGANLIVSPANVGLGNDEVDRHVADMRETYGETLKKLAE